MDLTPESREWRVRIGELARRAAVTIDTIRFYERRGVLPEPRRRPSGYRIYTEAAVERIP
jgi:DNA-binding transcriptional MerR regulator